MPRPQTPVRSISDVAVVRNRGELRTIDRGDLLRRSQGRIGIKNHEIS